VFKYNVKIKVFNPMIGVFF